MKVKCSICNGTYNESFLEYIMMKALTAGMAKPICSKCYEKRYRSNVI